MAAARATSWAKSAPRWRQVAARLARTSKVRRPRSVLLPAESLRAMTADPIRCLPENNERLGHGLIVYAPTMANIRLGLHLC